MKLEAILRDVKINDWSGPRDVEVHSVAYNSKLLLHGGLFCTWKGENSDGHRFVPDVLSKGAVAVVVEQPVETATCSRIIVPSGRAALSIISANFYSRPAEKLAMIGVTGTNGKTSTATLIQSLLNRAGCKSGLLGTIEFDLGNSKLPANHTTPEGLDLQRYLDTMLRNECKACVMEVSSHALDQGRVECVPYRVAIFTNLTQDHLDYHGTLENYFQSKLKLFSSLKAGQTAVVNVDDVYGKRILENIDRDVRIITYGLDAKADLKAEKIILSRTGTKFTLVTGNENHDINVPWLGRFNVENILAAISTMVALGHNLEQVVAMLHELPPVCGRMQIVPHKGDFTAVVDYAHTPDAVSKALETLRPLVTGKLVAVIGCGGNRDKKKRPLMAAVACRLADHVIFTSDNPRKEDPTAILDDMLAGVNDAKNFEVITDRSKAIDHAIQSAGKGDIVLLAGKGHETTQEIAGVKHHFSDIETAAECLAKRKTK